ncbi:MAG TPA: TRAP transporter small permease subunit [Thermoanaerobaculia bacterium]|nr:TRAP transporter small permease subunit [Thermoanaerobaculia bacterium]
MRAALLLANAIDRLTGWVGRAVAWLALVMVLVGAFNALARYGGRFIGVNLSSNLYLELQWYLFSVLFLLAAPWALREDAHVRVDVVFSRLSPRARAWVDVLGLLLLLLPFCAFTLWLSWPSVRASWAIREGSPDPGGLPRYPLKAVVLVCFALLLAQAAAELIRRLARLRGDLPLEGREHPRAREGA